MRFLVLFMILGVQGPPGSSLEEVPEKDVNIKMMLQEILRENKELKGELKNLKVNNTNNININVFLNETCKDAMNLTDF